MKALRECLVKFLSPRAPVKYPSGLDAGAFIFDQIMIFHTTGLDSHEQISYTVKAVTLALFAAGALPVIWRREGRGANAT